jgi:hypothetical protein
MAPEAVTLGADGYFRVNYDLLGLPFETYKQWVITAAHLPSREAARALTGDGSDAQKRGSAKATGFHEGWAEWLAGLTTMHKALGPLAPARASELSGLKVALVPVGRRSPAVAQNCCRLAGDFWVEVFEGDQNRLTNLEDPSCLRTAPRLRRQ